MNTSENGIVTPAIIAEIKKNNAWYVHSAWYVHGAEEGVLLTDENFGGVSFIDFVDLKKDQLDVINEEGTREADGYETTTGDTINEINAINLENRQKLIHNWVNEADEETIEFEKDYCTLTNHFHDWTSRAETVHDRLRELSRELHEVCEEDEEAIHEEADKIIKDFEKEVEEYENIYNLIPITFDFSDYLN